MGRLMDQVQAFFDAEGFSTTPGEAPQTLILRVREASGQWACVAFVIEEHEQFVFYSVAPLLAPPERLAQVAEYLHRANWGLRIGNFELDWSDGQIRYKTSLSVRGMDLTADMVQGVIYPNIVLMDRYLPGLVAVITEGRSALDAILSIEGN